MFNKRNPIRRMDWATDQLPTGTAGKLLHLDYTISRSWLWIERNPSAVGCQLGGE